MKSYVRALLVAMSTVVVGGCASMMIGSQPWFDQHDYGKKALAERASFDLSCAREQLQFLCVGPGSDCSSVGVSGCDKKATYEFVADRWVMNNAASATAAK
ncbi:hypothetical protein [Chondromyces apiculatus]|uniref:Lipoprotein n=1 Tax=Chondromyces apiculatus DSM 436 TaxID=1192034 RepID=A0A017T8P7_9BACT|nr:hypothetical protein [Chondromyces apiculatus]EYF05185.1 Hypothetical protein CAP_3550 [Chondromyces apiculatus DSM 436]